MKSATAGSPGHRRHTARCRRSRDSANHRDVYGSISRSIGGTVRNAAGSADASVSVFPVERRAWVDYGSSPRRLQRVQPNQAGAYRITGVPAGEYFVAAVADDRSVDWRDPRHLDALSRIATRVTLADEESKALDLSARRAPTTSPASDAAHASAGPFVAEVADAPRPWSSGPFVAEADLAQRAPPRATPRAAPQPTGGGSIAGVITTDSASPAPVRRVIVVPQFDGPEGRSHDTHR